MNTPWEETAAGEQLLDRDDLVVPAWWLGGPDRWRDAVVLYARLRVRERQPLRACRWGMAGALGGAVGVLYAGLAHSVSAAGRTGVDFGSVGAAFVVLVLLSMAAYEIALSRRGRYVALCAALWGDLSIAVRDGLVDGPGVFAGPADEQGLASALRQEVEVVLRHRAAGGALQPRLTHFSKRIFGLRPVGGLESF